jgi:hypothetical protein
VRKTEETMKIRVMSIALFILFLTASIVASPPCPSSFSIPQPDVTDIAVDETDVYFSHEGFIRRVSKEGGSPIVIAKLSGKWVMYLVTDDTNVYFAARDKTDRVDAVYRISKNGGAATLLVKGIYAAEMIPDGDWLYIAYPGLPARKIPGQIIRVKKDGSAIETVVTGLRMTMGMLLEGE